MAQTQKGQRVRLQSKACLLHRVMCIEHQDYYAGNWMQSTCHSRSEGLAPGSSNQETVFKEMVFNLL
jgi:hypothetical protein